MLFPTQLALLAGLLTPALAFNVSSWSWYHEDGTIEERHAPGCVKGAHIVALGGGGTTKGDLGLFTSTADGVQAAIPHSVVHQIGYPAGADAPTSIAYGTKHLNHHIRGFTKRCPKTQVILMGYSDGAAAVMDVVCGDVSTGKNALPSKYKKFISSTILYGDLTFITGENYDVGTCTSHDGVVPRAKPGKCKPFTRHIQSYCDEGDPQCCGDGQGDPSVHFSYPGKYDSAVAAYTKMRFQARKKNRSH